MNGFARVTLLTSVLTLTLRGAELPSAPPGFAWESLADIQAYILKPAGWVLKHQTNGQAGTYNLSPGGAATNALAPAFALNWVQDVVGKTKLSPAKYSAALADAAGQDHRLEDRSTVKQGAFSVISFRYTDSPPGQPPMVLRYQFWANDRTGSLFVAAFEAPAKEWDSAWKKGRVIADSLRLDEAK